MSQNEMYRVLIVDDDAVYLRLLEAQLEKWNIYEVTTAENAKEALDMLRNRSFDLVVSDVHMPVINGFQLLRQINQEFHLPVILISTDSSAQITGIMNGAQNFMVKPIEANDLKEIWQYSLWWKKTKQNVTSITTKVDEISFEGDVEMTADDHHNNINDEDAPGSSSDTTTERRKSKLVWTAQLHSRFVEALLVIGYHDAIPRTIVEVMNVPGITKLQVSSHLQKYRKLLQDVLDGKKFLDYNNWVDLKYYSNFVSGNPDSLLLNQLKEGQHNINIKVRARKRSSSNQYRPLPPFTAAGNATIPNPCNENTRSDNTSNYIHNTIPLRSNLYSQPTINVGAQNCSNLHNDNNFSVNQQPDSEEIPDIRSWFNNNEEMTDIGSWFNNNGYN